MSAASVIVVGGGIIGLSTAMSLMQSGHKDVVVIEAENRLAAHQTGNNSGVIHSGLYYKPGSAKARLCADGRELLYQFCDDEKVAHERCGKIVVAARSEEIPALDELYRRGLANGLADVARLDSAGIREREPHVQGLAGLWVPQTGIVDYRGVCAAMARRIVSMGGQICKGTVFRRCRKLSRGLSVTTSMRQIQCDFLINCAGLQSDRVARRCGVDPQIRIIPFRGEYYDLVPDARGLIRNLVYPVPDARFPFLGVHFTRMALGGIEAGPNAVLAFKREGYQFFDISVRDMWETVAWPGFQRMACRYWRMGLSEIFRSLSKSAFHRALSKLVPSVRLDQIVRSGSGVRAQAVDWEGRLLDDFHIVRARSMIHVLNAPSPAATASISIGRHIAGLVGECAF